MRKLSLGHFPTPIEKMEAIKVSSGQDLYIKRDDFSGIEVSGNKIRKLEYSLAEAIDLGFDMVVTTGAIQSNHCRATAAAAAKLGLPCEVMLTNARSDKVEGNHFLDFALGATISFVPLEAEPDVFISDRLISLKKAGHKPYFIPIGASNAIGSLGYRDCYREIVQEEEELGITFDAISLAVGSGGTYAGLWFENHMQNKNKTILGYSVSATAIEFEKKIRAIVEDMSQKLTKPYDVPVGSIHINDEYIGQGYAKSTQEEISFIVNIARKTGILFDPCYTGKALRGLITDLQSGKLSEYKNLLFIHTGGLMGWTEAQRKLALTCT